MDHLPVILCFFHPMAVLQMPAAMSAHLKLNLACHLLDRD